MWFVSILCFLTCRQVAAMYIYIFILLKYVEHIYWCVSFSSLRRLFMLFGLDSGISEGREGERRGGEEREAQR
jgi:hypothetical protein